MFLEIRARVKWKGVVVVMVFCWGGVSFAIWGESVCGEVVVIFGERFMFEYKI